MREQKAKQKQNKIKTQKQIDKNTFHTTTMYVRTNENVTQISNAKSWS